MQIESVYTNLHKFPLSVWRIIHWFLNAPYGVVYLFVYYGQHHHQLQYQDLSGIPTYIYLYEYTDHDIAYYQNVLASLIQPQAYDL